MFRKGGLKEHQNRVHFKITKKVECEICGEMIDKEYLKDHIVDNHGEKIQCEVCDRMFATEKAYKSHKEKHEASKYDCKICNRVYSRKSDLITHKQAAHHQFELEFC